MLLRYSPQFTDDEVTNRNLLLIKRAIDSIADAQVVTNGTLVSATITAATVVYHNLGHKAVTWEIVGGTGVGGLHESSVQPADSSNSISLTPDAAGGVFLLRFN